MIVQSPSTNYPFYTKASPKLQNLSFMYMVSGYNRIWDITDKLIVLDHTIHFVHPKDLLERITFLYEGNISSTIPFFYR